MAAFVSLRSIIVACFFCGPQFCYGEALTWETCILMTARHNPDILSAAETLKSSGYQINSAYGGFFPQLTGSLNYNYSGTFTPAAITSPASAGGFVSPFIGPIAANSVYSASLTGTQNLFSGFQDKARVDQAKALEQVSIAGLQTARAKASYDLKFSFAAMLYAQSSISLAQEIIRRREENLNIVTLRFQSGRENRGSFELSQAYLMQARYELLLAQDQLDVAKQQLARVLGLDESNDIKVTGLVPMNEPPATADFKVLALESPDYHQSLGQEQSAEAGITLARANLFPSLSLTGTTSNIDSHWPPGNNNWSIGAGLTWAFFSGGKDYFATRSASNTYRAAAFTRDGILRQTLTRLRQLYATFLESVEKLKIDQVFVRAAATRETIGRAKYNNGLLSFDDWDIIENDFVVRQKNVLQSTRDRAIAEAAWEQGQGKGVIP